MLLMAREVGRREEAIARGLLCKNHKRSKLSAAESSSLSSQPRMDVPKSGTREMSSVCLIVITRGRAFAQGLFVARGDRHDAPDAARRAGSAAARENKIDLESKVQQMGQLFRQSYSYRSLAILRPSLAPRRGREPAERPQAKAKHGRHGHRHHRQQQREGALAPQTRPLANDVDQAVGARG